MPSTAPVLVQPLRLAGPGDRRLVTSPLTAVHGWTPAPAPADGTRFTSPCRTAVLTVDGGVGSPAAWTVHGRHQLGVEPLWRASFSSGTPAEVVAAFTTTLAEDLHTQYYLHRVGTPASVLADRGWRPCDRSPRGFHDQLAPDGWALYRHRLGHQPYDDEVARLVPPTWSMLAGSPQQPSWCAEFTIGVPFHPLTQAAAAFSDPGPALRRADGIPARHLARVTVLRRPSVRSTSPPVPTEAGRPRLLPPSRPAPAPRRR
ncbi:DUF317 domain-containing protein [Kitasatospora phosalacinea]|uniref:DUF317 domain-containing protein n=1 Tax=Kitasatospora phosalacinea TaxID=2065 RepID=A0A9W6USD5_9ACTN|nr:DUF317 domain-containing protein [Kitasatospora phosalacinea]GLW58017.1 hypothetical protein Kpho01_60280 [Kitasatospora phosalacinea]